MDPQTSTLKLQPAGEAPDDFARQFLAGSAGAALQLALDALAAGDLAMALDQTRNAAGVLEDLAGPDARRVTEGTNTEAINV